MAEETTTLNVSIETLRDLLDDVEADFGFEYAYDDGLRALQELRRIIGGVANQNVRSEQALLPSNLEGDTTGFAPSPLTKRTL